LSPTLKNIEQKSTITFHSSFAPHFSPNFSLFLVYILFLLLLETFLPLNSF
jgi:hypothetical protein